MHSFVPHKCARVSKVGDIPHMRDQGFDLFTAGAPHERNSNKFHETLLRGIQCVGWHIIIKVYSLLQTELRSSLDASVSSVGQSNAGSDTFCLEEVFACGLYYTPMNAAGRECVSNNGGLH